MKKLSKSLVLLFVTFIFVACTGLFSPKGKVAVKLPGIAGSRAAVNYSPEDIEYYEVLLQSEKLVDKKTAAPGTEIVFSEIEQGDYSITISGYKKDADKTVLVAQGTKDVQIIGGLTSNVEITLSLLQKPEIPESPETPDEPGSTDTPSEWDLKPSDFNGIERKDNTPIKEIYLTFTDEYYAVGKTNNFFNTTLPNKSFKAEVLYDDNKSYTFSSLANIRAFQFTLPCNDEDIPYVGQQVPVTCAYLDTASGSKNETVTACIKPLTISVLYNTVIPSVSFVSGSATISSINIPAYTGSANFSVNRSYEQIEYPVYGTETSVKDEYTYNLTKPTATEFTCTEPTEDEPYMIIANVFNKDSPVIAKNSYNFTHTMTVTQSDYAVSLSSDNLIQTKTLPVTVYPYYFSDVTNEAGNIVSGKLYTNESSPSTITTMPYYISIKNDADSSIASHTYTFTINTISSSYTKTSATQNTLNFGFLSSAVSSSDTTFTITCEVKYSSSTICTLTSKEFTLAKDSSSTFSDGLPASFTASCTSNKEAGSTLTKDDFSITVKDSSDKELSSYSGTFSFNVPKAGTLPYIGQVPVSVTYTDSENGIELTQPNVSVNFVHTMSAPKEGTYTFTKLGGSDASDATVSSLTHLSLSYVADTSEFTSYANYPYSTEYKDDVSYKYYYKLKGSSSDPV